MLKQRQGTCIYLHTPRLLQTHGSPHSPARQTQTGQHTHIPSLTLTFRHAHRGLSLWFHIVYHRENKCFCSLAQRKGKEKMEVNVSASKREGKDTKQGRQPQHPHYHPCPAAPPLPTPSLQGQAWASLVGSGASDELVPSMAGGPCKLGWRNLGHSDLSCGVQPCLRVSVQVHHAGRSVCRRGGQGGSSWLELSRTRTLTDAGGGQGEGEGIPVRGNSMCKGAGRWEAAAFSQGQ